MPDNQHHLTAAQTLLADSQGYTAILERQGSAGRTTREMRSRTLTDVSPEVAEQVALDSTRRSIFEIGERLSAANEAIKASNNDPKGVGKPISPAFDYGSASHDINTTRRSWAHPEEHIPTIDSVALTPSARQKQLVSSANKARFELTHKIEEIERRLAPDSPEGPLTENQRGQLNKALVELETANSLAFRTATVQHSTGYDVQRAAEMKLIDAGSHAKASGSEVLDEQLRQQRNNLAHNKAGTAQLVRQPAENHVKAELRKNGITSILGETFALPIGPHDKRTMQERVEDGKFGDKLSESIRTEEARSHARFERENAHLLTPEGEAAQTQKLLDRLRQRGEEEIAARAAKNAAGVMPTPATPPKAEILPQAKPAQTKPAPAAQVAEALAAPPKAAPIKITSEGAGKAGLVGMAAAGALTFGNAVAHGENVMAAANQAAEAVTPGAHGLKLAFSGNVKTGLVSMARDAGSVIGGIVGFPIGLAVGGAAGSVVPILGNGIGAAAGATAFTAGGAKIGGDAFEQAASTLINFLSGGKEVKQDPMHIAPSHSTTTAQAPRKPHIPL